MVDTGIPEVPVRMVRLIWENLYRTKSVSFYKICTCCMKSQVTERDGYFYENNAGKEGSAPF